MTIGSFGPDPDQVGRWAGLNEPITHFRQFDDASEAAWATFDAVLLDLQLLRVGTSGTDVDITEASSTLQQTADFNRDAFWLVITPPALVDTGHRLARALGERLQSGIHATEVISEPHQADAVSAKVRAWLDEIARINAIPLDIADMRPFTDAEIRCIRRLLGDCQAARLRPLGDGLSDAVVIRADCQLDGGAAPPRVIKVGPREKILREHRNYLDYARYRLGLGRCPHHDTTDIWMAASAGAASYSFAAGPAPRTLAEVMQVGDGRPALHDLWERVMTPWLGMQQAGTEPIGAFIGSCLGGLSFDEVSNFWDEAPLAPAGTWSPIPWVRGIAGRVNDVLIPSVIAHGDLHPYNVLVDEADQAWLIDFYHTGRRSGLFDFAYSDVALMLHRIPGKAVAAIAVGNAELLAGEQHYYAGGEPARPELEVGRTTALNTWGVDNAALLHLARACNALRLLRYDSTDKPLAKVVASLAAARARTLRPGWENAPEIAPIVF